jgi:CBS domain-containing protein
MTEFFAGFLFCCTRSFFVDYPSKFQAMSKISDILSRKGSRAISVSPDTPVLDALKVMAENNIGSVVVMENDRFSGIITERDYSRKVILKGKNSSDTRVSEIMTTEFPELKPEDTVAYCMELMTQRNIRYLPVFSGGNLAGIISISDVVKETILSQQQTIDHLHDYIHS